MLRYALPFIALALPLPVIALEVSGPVRPKDADTLVIGDQDIRLAGIDAFENGQSCEREGRTYDCGGAAEDALQALTRKGATCTGSTFDDYERLIATCVSDGLDINRELVLRGHALAYRRYSTAYLAEEEDARTARRGVWAGSFMAPWDFRVDRWAKATRSAPGADCPVKGNIDRRGVRIYHLPWSRFYARTTIDEARGERWFCSEIDAQRAGWRASRR